jgi:hypothetical protein
VVHGVEGRAQVDRDDRVPALGREVLDIGDELDAGVVDQDVHAAEPGLAGLHQRGDLCRLAHVGTVVAHVGRPSGLDLGLGAVGIAEAVEHDLGALGSQGLGDAQADAAGGASDEGSLSCEHGWVLRRVLASS